MSDRQPLKTVQSHFPSSASDIISKTLQTFIILSLGFCPHFLQKRLVFLVVRSIINVKATQLLFLISPATINKYIFKKNCFVENLIRLLFQFVIQHPNDHSQAKKNNEN